MNTTIALGNRTYSIPLPYGWRRVWSGPALFGDRWLDPLAIQASGHVRWCDLELARKRGPDARLPDATLYACLIRVGEPVDAGCAACGCYARLPSETVCERCWRAAKGVAG